MSFFKKLFGSSKKKDISSTNDDTLKDDNLIDKSKPPINKKKSNTKKQLVEKDFFKENQTDIKQGKFDKNASFVNKSSDLKKEKVSKKKSIYKKEVVLNKPSDNKKIDKQTKKSIFSNFFSKQKKQSLDKGLEKTSSSFFNKISKVIVGKSKVDDEVLDELEEILISSDVGVKTTLKIIDSIESRVSKDKYIGSNELDIILKEEIMGVVDSSGEENQFIISNKKPHVILVVGVNGVGKTTSIGKMANHYKSLGLKVVIGASDTFRAAAIEQLEIWAKRVDVDLIKQEMGSDPASVAFDTLESAINKNADVVLIDTAGRLHNKVNLMNELGKIKRVLQKKNIDAPQEIILVIDGSTGQNAFEQAKQFSNVTEITSLVVTKLDGTAKGGVVLGISDQFRIPIKFIGIGEGLEDLQLFNKKEFVNSFFNKSKKY
jgi:fused signal recognition particle receptor